jgi:hypothetical protein
MMLLNRTNKAPKVLNYYLLVLLFYCASCSPVADFCGVYIDEADNIEYNLSSNLKGCYYSKNGDRIFVDEQLCDSCLVDPD